MAGGARINVATQIKDGIITAAKMAGGAIVTAASRLTTSTLTVSQPTTGPINDNTLQIKPTTGDVQGTLAVSPAWTSEISSIQLHHLC